MTPTTELAEKLERACAGYSNGRTSMDVELILQAADTLRKQAEELERCRTALSSVVALDDLLEKRRVRENPEVRKMTIEGGEVVQGAAVDNFFALLDAIHNCGNHARTALNPARSAYNEPKQNGEAK